VAGISFDPEPPELRAYWNTYALREAILRRLGELDVHNAVNRVNASEAPIEARDKLYGHRQRLIDMMTSRAREEGIQSLYGELTASMREELGQIYKIEIRAGTASPKPEPATAPTKTVAAQPKPAIAPAKAIASAAAQPLPPPEPPTSRRENVLSSLETISPRPPTAAAPPRRRTAQASATRAFDEARRTRQTAAIATHVAEGDAQKKKVLSRIHELKKGLWSVKAKELVGPELKTRQGKNLSVDRVEVYLNRLRDEARDEARKGGLSPTKR
jgi:hypothetical protein